MEKLKKTFRQILTTGSTTDQRAGYFLIIPDTGVTYSMKFLLTADVTDIGFLDPVDSNIGENIYYDIVYNDYRCIKKNVVDTITYDNIIYGDYKCSIIEDVPPQSILTLNIKYLCPPALDSGLGGSYYINLLEYNITTYEIEHIRTFILNNGIVTFNIGGVEFIVNDVLRPYYQKYNINGGAWIDNTNNINTLSFNMSGDTTLYVELYTDNCAPLTTSTTTIFQQTSTTTAPTTIIDQTTTLTPTTTLFVPTTTIPPRYYYYFGTRNLCSSCNSSVACCSIIRSVVNNLNIGSWYKGNDGYAYYIASMTSGTYYDWDVSIINYIYDNPCEACIGLTTSTTTSYMPTTIYVPTTTSYIPTTAYVATTEYIPTTTTYNPTTTLYVATSTNYIPTTTIYIPTTDYIATTTTIYVPTTEYIPTTTSYVATTIYSPTTTLYVPTTTILPQLIINDVVYDCNNSIITITISGGIPNYRYSIDNGVTLTTPTNLTTYQFSGLTGGTYYVYVEDSSYQYYRWSQVTCDQINIKFEPVYLTSYSIGYVYDHNNMPHTTPFTVSGVLLSTYDVSSTVANNTDFLGWSLYKPTKESFNNINYLSKLTTYHHIFRGNTTIYAIFNKNVAQNLIFCYYQTVADYNATIVDKEYYCNTCSQTATIYYNINDFNTMGFEKIKWYKDSALTIEADAGYYKLYDTNISDSNTPIFKLINGMPSIYGYCGNIILPSC